MDEAQAKALQEKYQRKVQHLEAGGHNTSKLREHLEGTAYLQKYSPWNVLSGVLMQIILRLF